ncbi:MAG: Fpg/Nei family DNA glycosylase [Myxococcales bacterium]|nr:Fpg/Nei family DNA glycosylase [Myxococcales bacterium]MCB9530942.1 Fpg/Nei family DNA glycosylase [Myxococcales bacterium]
MPELPEVEIMARNAHAWAADARIVELRVDDPAVVRAGLDLLAAAPGAQVRRARRRAKYMVLETSAFDLVVHFRMTGKWVRSDTRAARLRITTTLGEVALVDTRRLAEIWALPPASADAWLAARGLGDEPFPEVRDGEWWRARLEGAGAIKPALMDGARVAGIGNIVATEACWRARVWPWARPTSLDADGWAALAGAVRSFIADALAADGGDEIAYVNEGGAPPSYHAVYRLGGRPCARCGAPIAKATQAARSTYWCPGCQLLGADAAPSAAPQGRRRR